MILGIFWKPWNYEVCLIYAWIINQISLQQKKKLLETLEVLNDMIVLVEATLVSRISVQIQISVQGGILTKNQISVHGGILLKILIIRDFIYSLNFKKAK